MITGKELYNTMHNKYTVEIWNTDSAYNSSQTLSANNINDAIQIALRNYNEVGNKRTITKITAKIF